MLGSGPASAEFLQCPSEGLKLFAIECIAGLSCPMIQQPGVSLRPKHKPRLFGLLGVKVRLYLYNIVTKTFTEFRCFLYRANTIRMDFYTAWRSGGDSDAKFPRIRTHFFEKGTSWGRGPIGIARSRA